MQDKANPISVKELLAGDVQLASPPTLYLKLAQVIDSPNFSLQQASRIIEHDASLTARLLRIVNSAFYGFPAKVASITKAISILGIKELRDLVLATVVVDRFSSLPNGIMPMRQFWALSVRCAIMARCLAGRHAERNRFDSIFVCGLLHELGRLVVYHRVPELARAAVLLARRENIDEYIAERQIMGLDHYEVGAELMRRWRLPEVIVLSCQHHGEPAAAEMFQTETQICCLASHLSLLEGIDDSGAVESMLSRTRPLWEALQMNPAMLAEVMAETDAVFLDIFKQIYLGR